MKGRLLFIFLAASPLSQTFASDDPLCEPLRRFVESVKPDETRSFDFHTSWGGGFKDSSERVIFAKRCNHYDYDQAEAVCGYLIKNGAVEFAGDNFERAVICLSPKTRFGPGVGLSRTLMTLTYGSHERGVNVTLEYGEDSNLGGMVMKVTAEGFGLMLSNKSFKPNPLRGSA